MKFSNRASTIAGILMLMLGPTACSDNEGESNSPIGAYRLESVDGHKVPYATINQLVRSGDLVLRSDNTAQYVIRSPSQELNAFNANYRVNGNHIDFVYNGVTIDSGTITGDAIIANMRFHRSGSSGTAFVRQSAVFRKVIPDPVAVRSGTYVLTTVANRPIADHGPIGSWIDFDTLHFTDGVFFTRHWKRSVFIVGLPDTSSSEVSTFGTYHGNANYLLLGAFPDTSTVHSAPNSDSLIFNSGKLILRRWAANGEVLEDRYEKRP